MPRICRTRLTLVYAIGHARGMMDTFRRVPEETRSYAALVVSLSAEHGFPLWKAGGHMLEGRAATTADLRDARALLNTLSPSRTPSAMGATITIDANPAQLNR